MKCRKNKMPRLSCCKSRFHCLRVTHFTYQYDVRIFTQDGPQAVRVASRVYTDLTLVYDGAVRLVNILYGILECDNMFSSRVIDLIQDRSERCGLTTSGLTCHENYSFVV